MKKPSPFLPLSCGLLLYLLGMLCCSFRQEGVPFAPFPTTDTALFRIDLLPATATAPMKLSVSTTTGVRTNIRIEWQVLLNGLPGRKGVFLNVSLVPHHPTVLRLPLKLQPGNEEAWLRVICRHSHTSYVRLLPLRPWRGDASIPPTGEITFNDSNNIFTITAPNTLIEFDKESGWLLHYEAGHVLLMDDTAGVQPALWPKIPPRLQLFSTSTGPQLVIVRAEYTLPETASLLHLSYTINAAGDMLVSQTLEADTAQHLPDSVHLPALPGFGMRWLLPPGLDTITTFGATDTSMPTSSPTPATRASTSPPSPEPTPASTSPAVPAPARASISPPAPPALVHRAPIPAIDTRETRWLTITGHNGAGLRITADSAMLETGIAAFTDSTNSTKRLLLLLNNSSDSLHHYRYKVTPVPAKPF